MAEFLLDTEAASRPMRAERRAVTSLRRSDAKVISISSITMAELLYGARLREDALGGTTTADADKSAD